MFITSSSAIVIAPDIARPCLSLSPPLIAVKYPIVRFFDLRLIRSIFELLLDHIDNPGVLDMDLDVNERCWWWSKLCWKWSPIITGSINARQGPDIRSNSSKVVANVVILKPPLFPTWLYSWCCCCCWWLWWW